MSSALTLGSPSLLTAPSSLLTAPNRLSIEYNGPNQNFKFNPTPSESMRVPSPSPLGKPSKELKASSITPTPAKKSAAKKTNFLAMKNIKIVEAKDLEHGAVFDMEL